MNDSFQIKKPVALDKVNQNDLGELIWWSVHMQISPEKILSAINKVGNSSEEIRKYVHRCKK